MKNTKKDSPPMPSQNTATLAPYLSNALSDASEIDVTAYLSRIIDQANTSPEPLPEQVSAYIQAALAASSRKKYQSDLRQFINWGGLVPASPVQVAKYLAAHGNTHAPATLQRWLVAIGKAHTTQSLPNPCKSEIVHLTLRGIRRTRITPDTQALVVNNEDKITGIKPLNAAPSKRKRGPTGSLRGQVRALELEDLKRMIRGLSDSAKDHRDRALLLVGFMGARRRSELIAITVGDLDLQPEGVIIQIPYSKTDQEGKGEEIEIGYAEDPDFCPVRALYFWIESYVAPLYPLGLTPDTVVFRAVNRHGMVNKVGLSDRSVARIIKNHCMAIGLSVDDFSGHSLRAGFATAAAKQDKPAWQIRKQTLHKSDTMLNRYIRDGQRFKNNPGKGML